MRRFLRRKIESPYRVHFNEQINDLFKKLEILKMEEQKWDNELDIVSRFSARYCTYKKEKCRQVREELLTLVDKYFISQYVH